MSKILFLYIVLLFTASVVSADAQTLDLDIGDNLGMNPTIDDSNIDDSINMNFSYSVERVNNAHGSFPAFEIIIGNIEVNTNYFETNTTTAWNATAVLSKYISWSEWVAISHQTADLYKLAFNKTSNAFNRERLDDVKLKSIFPIPEPATMLLLGVGLIGLSGLRNRITK